MTWLLLRTVILQSTVNIAGLQRIHNSVARLILLRRRSDSNTALLCQLHWLHSEPRVDVQLRVISYKALLKAATRKCIDVNSLAVSTDESTALCEQQHVRTVPCPLQSCSEFVASVKRRLNAHFFCTAILVSFGRNGKI